MSFVDFPGEHAANGASKVRDGWPEPIDLPGLPEVPAWSDVLLPDALRPWLSDVTERTQCPPEYPAVGAIVALASVIGRGCTIRPKQKDDWTVVPNLWGAVVGKPAWMKSPALSEAMRPLNALVAESSTSHAQREFERESIEARRRALKDEMAKAAKKKIVDLNQWREQHDEIGLKSKYEEIANAAAAADAERRYIVYDSTVEKLGELLAQSPRGLLLFRDELVGFLSSLDRSGHENDRSFYLESWNGVSSYVYDRIARGTVKIDSACMSILGGIQPGPLSSYLRGAVAGGAGADGLMQRFQVIVYPDAPTTWTNVDRWPNTNARATARTLYAQLANATAEDLGADSSDGLPFVRFEPAAQELFDDWRSKLENRLREGAEHDAIEGHLTKYRSLLPSLALIFHLADGGVGPVRLKATQRASDWCTLLEAHMRRLYAAVAADKISSAKLLLGKLRTGKLQNPFVARDAYRPQWAGLEKADVEAAIGALVEYGWAKVITVHTGGHPRDEVHVHPSL